MSAHTPTLTSDDPWLTSQEVYALYRIHPVTLCELRAKHQGPDYRRLGRSIHYRRSAVEAYIARHTVTTAS